MPEDTRVQQQVHMHIWMEADIIMVIVSDARRAVKRPYRAMLNVTEGGAVETHRM
jgi:hypothetical protein